MAAGLCFSARKQTHDHSNYEQRDDTNSDIQRTDFIHQPLFSSGVGLAIGGVGEGDAFLAASIDCEYCRRWNVSLSCGLTFSTA